MKKQHDLLLKIFSCSEERKNQKENREWVKRQLEKTARLGGKLLLTF